MVRALVPALDHYRDDEKNPLSLEDAYARYREKAEELGRRPYALRTFMAGWRQWQKDENLPDDDEKKEGPRAPVVTNLARFTDKQFLESTPLSECHERLELPPESIKVISLMLHQQIDAAAMLLLEEQGYLTDISDNRRVEATCGVMTENFGAGKTIIIGAVITKRQTPPIRPQWLFVPSYVGNRINPCESYMIRREFAPEAVLRPNLIFAESSVILQFETQITTFFNLRVLTVRHVKELQILYARMKNGTINEFDVVLAKNGIITGDLKLARPEKCNNGKHQRKIVNMIANMTSELGVAWSRVWYDDYDMASRVRSNAAPAALWSWYVSATMNQSKTKIQDDVEHETLVEILRHHRTNLQHLMQNNIFRNALNVRTDPELVDKSVNIGTPTFWKYETVNPNKKLIHMIGEMAGEQAREIMDALNADAIGAAAKAAGIEETDIASIFKRVLEKQYYAYQRARVTLDFIALIDKDELAGDTLPAPHEGDSYTMKDVYDRRPIDYAYPDILGKVERVEQECKEALQTSGKAIERMKDSLKDGDCPVCCGSFEGDDAIVVTCCAKVMCADCGIKATRMGRGHGVSGKCPSCTRAISIKSMIFINKDFDINSLIDENAIGDALAAPAPRPPDEEKSSGEGIECIALSKHETLVHIIRGSQFRDRQEMKNVQIVGLLQGSRELPPPAARKFVVFSKYEESLESLEKTFAKNNLKYSKMGGTADELRAKARAFNETDDIPILLINGEKYASGINLQNATDLVFMHKIKDPAVEAQIMGRIQRIGRTCAATIHYVVYDDEQ
jgi:hypothetical protein